MNTSKNKKTKFQGIVDLSLLELSHLLLNLAYSCGIKLNKKEELFLYFLDNCDYTDLTSSEIPDEIKAIYNEFIKKNKKLLNTIEIMVNQDGMNVDFSEKDFDIDWKLSRLKQHPDYNNLINNILDNFGRIIN